jgi:hypothetical protein
MMYFISWKKLTAHLALLYPAKLSFTTEGEIKSFHDIQKQKEFMTTMEAT